MRLIPLNPHPEETLVGGLREIIDAHIILEAFYNLMKSIISKKY